MIVIDEVGERPLLFGEGESFGDRNDIVAPSVDDDGRTRLRLRRRRQSGQIEGRRHQEKP